MAEKKKQVKPAAKKDPKKTLKGAKKLGETKLMMVLQCWWCYFSSSDTWYCRRRGTSRKVLCWGRTIGVRRNTNQKKGECNHGRQKGKSSPQERKQEDSEGQQEVGWNKADGSFRHALAAVASWFCWPPGRERPPLAPRRQSYGIASRRAQTPDEAAYPSRSRTERPYGDRTVPPIDPRRSLHSFLWPAVRIGEFHCNLESVGQ